MGKKLNKLKGHTDNVSLCNFSPCSNFIVSGSYDNTVKIWVVLFGKLLKTIEGQTDSVLSCNFSPCGQFIVSGSFDKTVKSGKSLLEIVLKH